MVMKIVLQVYDYILEKKIIYIIYEHVPNKIPP